MRYTGCIRLNDVSCRPTVQQSLPAPNVVLPHVSTPCMVLIPAPFPRVIGPFDPRVLPRPKSVLQLAMPPPSRSMRRLRLINSLRKTQVRSSPDSRLRSSHITRLSLLDENKSNKVELAEARYT